MRMRNVVLYHQISLDGVALADDTDWFDDGSREMFAILGRDGQLDHIDESGAPATVGEGRRIFAGTEARQALKLSEVTRSPVGTLFVTYRRAGT